MGYRYKGCMYHGLLRRFDGTKWIVQLDQNFSSNAIEYYTKTSVDSGRFTPGIYRVNPYSVSDEEYSFDPSTVNSYQYVYYGTRYEMTWTGQVAAWGASYLRDVSMPTALTTMASEALQKAQAKLGSGDFSLGEDLAELRETLQMLKNPLSALHDFLMKGNRKNLKKLQAFFTYLKSGTYGGSSGARAAKAASNAWLEFRYGWRPLIMLLGDLIEQANHVADKNFDPNKIRCVRASVSRTDEYIRPDFSYPVFMGTGYASRKFKDELRANASIQYKQAYPLGTFANLGLSPRYWPETAWELTKLSFVWDWVITIGPWLQGFRVKPEITVLGNTVGKKLTRHAEMRNYKVYTGYGEGVAGKPLSGGASWTYRSYVRSVNVAPPPLPVFRLGNVFDTCKIIDTLALILQRIIR